MLQKTRISFGLAAISAAIIAYQISLMRILSFTQWYHFAYMVISVALLGFGAAGTILSLFREKLISNYNRLLPGLSIATVILMIGGVLISQLEVFRFDSFLIFSQRIHVVKLILTYFIFLLPFITGSLVIGLIFTHEASRIGKIYFFNLAGSGVGGLVALFALSYFDLHSSLAISALLALFGAILFTKGFNRQAAGVALIAITALVGYWGLKPDFKLSQFKGVTKTLDMMDSQEINRVSGSHGVIQVIESPVLRYAPGLSLTYTGDVPDASAVFVDGNWHGALSKVDSISILTATTRALPYEIEDPERILILGSGTGNEISLAMNYRPSVIDAVELNTQIVEVSGYPDTNVIRVHVSDPRAYLSSSTIQHDLVVLPVVGSLGGSGGINALQENYLFTKEAFHRIWQSLSPDGMVTCTMWIDYPARSTLRLFSLFRWLADHNQVAVTDHLIAVKSWGTITVVMKKSPITDDEIKKVSEFTDRLQFDPLVIKGGDDSLRYNQFQDPDYVQLIREVVGPGSNQDQLESYPFRITPPSDNQPFFYQHLRWDRLRSVTAAYGAGGVPFLEIGYVLLVVTFIQIGTLAAILILLPLLRFRWKRGHGSWTLIYFTGIGIGFMFVEMALIQKFNFYFSNPVSSASIVISALLVSSGAGSYISNRWELAAQGKQFIIVIALLLAAYSFIAMPVLEATIGWGTGLKALVAIVIIAVPGFVMGMPFPMALKYLHSNNAGIIPWAWGVNSCWSVVSAVLAIIVAVEFGFDRLLWIAATGYGLAFAATRLRIAK